MSRTLTLPEDSVFVFGSNILGIHGRGAALDARTYFGAVMGKGYGHYGQSFAIPTKYTPSESLSPATIECFVEQFLVYAIQNPKLTFVVTPIGTGLAGNSMADMARLFAGHPNNVTFTDATFERLISRKEVAKLSDYDEQHYT